MRYFLLAALCAHLVACSRPLAAESQFLDQQSKDPSVSSIEQEVELWYPDDPTPPDRVEFRQLALKSNKAGKVQIANGVSVAVSDWPATLVSRAPRGPCTSNLVGPTTILTAAHCVDGRGKPAVALIGSVWLLKNGGPKEYRIISCTLHEAYRTADFRPRGLPRNTKDYAFCELETVVDFIKYETLSLSAAATDLTAPLMLGWGCHSIRLDEENRIHAETSEDVSKALRMGNGSIVAKDVAANLEKSGSPGRYLEHRSEMSEPTLCPGDSGGPLFAGPTTANQAVARKIIAVSSAVGGSRSADGKPVFHSYFASLAAPEFIEFAKHYIQTTIRPDGRQVIVCGVNQDPRIGGCHA